MSLSLRGVHSAAFLLRERLENELNVRAIVEGVILGQMQGNIYRSKENLQARLKLFTSSANRPLRMPTSKLSISASAWPRPRTSLACWASSRETE